VPGGITDPLCSFGIQIRRPGPPSSGIIESETVKRGHVSAGLGLENYCAGEDQQQLYTTDPSSRQRGYFVRTTRADVQLENKDYWS
jgi:hypothetical protein